MYKSSWWQVDFNLSLQNPYSLQEIKEIKKIQNFPIKDTRERREKIQNKSGGFCFLTNNTNQYTNRSSSLAYELFLDHGNFLHKLSRCSNMAPTICRSYVAKKATHILEFHFDLIETFIHVDFLSILTLMHADSYIHKSCDICQSINHCQNMYCLDVGSEY